MEIIFRITLFITGTVNFLPAILAFFPEKISNAYGIEIPNADLELLLRHRAILFGIVGGLMIYSSVSKKYYSVSVTVGLISMISFIILYFLMNGISTDLGKIMKIDLAAVLLLSFGFFLFKFES